MGLTATLVLAALVAGSPGKPRKVRNMPTGWTWPPSAAMKEAGARCLARLDAAGVAHTAAKPIKKVATPVALADLTISGITLVSLRDRPPHVLDCHLALALADVAPALRALGVQSLHFRTLHKLRNVRRGGKRTRMLSRHAVGLAVDVFAVGFDDGAVLSVEHDWRRQGRRLAQVAAAFESHASFRTPLTPANDPADHGDHVHLEAHMHLDAP